jgi:hypothetical protein
VEKKENETRNSLFFFFIFYFIFFLSFTQTKQSDLNKKERGRNRCVALRAMRI